YKNSTRIIFPIEDSNLIESWNTRKFFSILIIFTLLSVVSFQFLVPPVKAQSDSTPYTILFDESHNQYYTYSNQRFKTALDYLNQTVDFEVYLNKNATNKFNNITKLTGYDLIIIGNPGPGGDFSATEIEVLKNFTDLGGDLFLLCNYNDITNPTPNDTITGHAFYLNNLTKKLSLPAEFISYDLHTLGHHVPTGERWIIEIQSSKFPSTHPITQKLSSVLVFTSGLNITAPSDFVVTGYSDSYLENRTGNHINETPWLVATERGASKIILCGSTAIFSDTNITTKLGYDLTGVQWIDALDNLRLWANLIQWASIVIIPNFFTVFLIISLIIIAVGISLYIYATRIIPAKSVTVETKKQNLISEREMILKDARTNIDQGNYLSAAQLYKRAAKLSNELGELQDEATYLKKYQKFLAKSKK
ncbi:MAG: hypothetical protein LUQ65_00165, partial [Candidatus Helarchaeota archaeon]|nr:hypothetical protein [Candidatus Helarchaeota archaeon]